MFPLLSAISFSRDESTQWIVLAVGVLATTYLVMRGRAKGRRKDPFERPAAFGVSQQRQIERDVGNLMVEMLETARQMTAQLDTRAARVEVLIRQADERLAALKTATAAGAAGQSIVAKTDAPPAEAEAVPARPETPPDPRHADVYALADEGRSPHEIARHLNRPNGEVELILALRPH